MATQTIAFDFQGRLSDGDNPANGIYLLQFKLYAAAGDETRTARTSAFGYFRFADIAAGETYIFIITAKKRYSVSQALQRRLISEGVGDISFVADN